MEIDAASNRGIEEIRGLRETVKYAPASSKFRVYIIDEVHMLTKEAFNALLKTLEEPPEHVKFMFATTEPEKVLPTILSRCQRFDLRRIPAALIVKHLAEIAAKENVTISEPALFASRGG
jgi:DNA polymerase-3 subunit gamma/tau